MNTFWNSIAIFWKDLILIICDVSKMVSDFKNFVFFLST